MTTTDTIITIVFFVGLIVALFLIQGALAINRAKDLLPLDLAAFLINLKLRESSSEWRELDAKLFVNVLSNFVTLNDKTGAKLFIEAKYEELIKWVNAKYKPEKSVLDSFGRSGIIK